MDSVPMPRDLSEEAVAEWLYDAAVLKRMQSPGFPPDRYADWDEAKPVVRDLWRATARAVRALVEREVARERASTREKVREGVARAFDAVAIDGSLLLSNDQIVARVLGEEAPRG